jgi:DNA invertase Pin-like site-specific DNA recombinase
MSPRRDRSSGSRALGITGPWIASARAEAAQRTPGEHPTQVVFPKAIRCDSRPPEARARAPFGEDEVSGSEQATGPADRWCSSERSPASATPKRVSREARETVLGYASVDAGHGEPSKHDLRRQAAEIAGECERRELCLLDIVQERERRHQRALERPGLGYVLGRIAAGEVSGLVVVELSRVTHSVPELGRVLAWLSRRNARLVAAVPGFDTYDEAGRLVLRTLIEVSGWERQRLVERTRIGMRAARRKGPATVADNPELSERIAGMRARGMTLQAIADQLNADCIPTVRGGARWRPSSVQAAAGYQRPPASHALQL